MKKDLDITDVNDAKAKISDITVCGDGDMFQLLCKASSKSQGWMKSTKAMVAPGGVVLQVTTQQGENVAEALTYIPDATIVDDINGGKRLVSISVAEGLLKYAPLSTEEA